MSVCSKMRQLLQEKYTTVAAEDKRKAVKESSEEEMTKKEYLRKREGKRKEKIPCHLADSKTINPHAHNLIMKLFYRVHIQWVWGCVCEQINLVGGEDSPYPV